MPTSMKRVALVVVVLAFITGIAGYALISQEISRIYASNADQSPLGGASTGDWPMYQGNLGRSGFNAAETTITPSNASQLKLHWKHTARGSISSQVAVANGMLYWGSWDGIEHASDLSGTDVWTANLGQTSDTACNPPTVGVASTAAVATVPINGTPTSVVFVGGGNSIFYALNAQTGAIIWQAALGTPPSTFLWSSPIVYNGSVYEGISSFGDCPLVRGALVKMDASTSDATSINGTSCQGSVNALNPTDGSFIWRICQANGKALCPLVGAPGLLVVGQGRFIKVLNASSGGTLFSYQENVKGGIYRSPVISNGVIYIGNADGNLEAFGL